MLREHRRLIDRIGVAITGIIVYLAFYSWYIISDHFLHKGLEPFKGYAVEILIFIAVVLFSMLIRDVSAYKRFISIFHILKDIIICYFFGALGFGLYTYIFKIQHVSRFYLLGGMVFSYVVIALFFISYMLIWRDLRSRGLNYQSVILVGNEYTLPPFIHTLKHNKSMGLRVIGVMTLDEIANKKDFMGYRYLGAIDNTRKVLNTEAVDYVIFTVYRQNPQAVEKAMLICQERGIETWFKPDFMQKIIPPRIDYLDDIPLFVISMTPKKTMQLMMKRFFDIVSSLYLILVFAIPMLIIAILIRSSSKGPAIFKQKRMGLNGRQFVMYKFRTMHSELQQRRAEYRLKNEMKGPVFKMKKDPRITGIGYFLRKFSMDELPQFFNVLTGEMSIVGPRPPLPSEVSLYKGWHRRRLSMRPGITCVWQVSGRNKIKDFEEWVKLDLKYIDTWSLWLDSKILLRTIPAVFMGTGC